MTNCQSASATGARRLQRGAWFRSGVTVTSMRCSRTALRRTSARADFPSLQVGDSETVSVPWTAPPQQQA